MRSITPYAYQTHFLSKTKLILPFKNLLVSKIPSKTSEHLDAISTNEIQA